MESLDEKIMKLVRENPTELIKFLDEHKIDFDKMAKELDISRRLVHTKYAMDEQSITAVEFVFWFAYFVEREAQDLIIEPEVDAGGRREAIQVLTDKLHFGDKIKVISELYAKDPKDKFIKLMRKVQDLRNAIAHGRFDDLKYEGFDLSNAKGQLVILADLMNALLSKTSAK